MNEHTIERELKQPPPRQIRNRGGFLGSIKPFWWILLPHTWIAVAAPIVYCWLLGAHLFPQYKCEGAVTGHHVSVNRKGAASKHVTFVYSIKGQAQTGTDNVNDSIYAEIMSGKSTVPLDVNVNPLDNAYFVHIPQPGDTFLFAFGGLWVCVWTGIVSVLAYSCCHRSLLSRHLSRSGIPTTGEITGLRIKIGSKRAQLPMVQYRYAAKTEGAFERRSGELTAEIQVPRTNYNELKIGELVTVLYDQKRPSASIVYKCGDYEAVL